MTEKLKIERREASSVADPKAREFLRHADPVLARLIDAQPEFHPRAWLDELPPLDAFGTLAFQVVGQQLSVSATRTILSVSRGGSEDICRRRRSCSRQIHRSCAPAACRLARARRYERSRSGSSMAA